MNHEEAEKTCDTPPGCPGNKDDPSFTRHNGTLLSGKFFFAAIKDNLRKF